MISAPLATLTLKVPLTKSVPHCLHSLQTTIPLTCFTNSVGADLIDMNGFVGGLIPIAYKCVHGCNGCAFNAYELEGKKRDVGKVCTINTD